MKAKQTINELTCRENLIKSQIGTENLPAGNFNIAMKTTRN